MPAMLPGPPVAAGVYRRCPAAPLLAQAAVVVPWAAAAGAGVVHVATVAPVGAGGDLRHTHRCAHSNIQATKRLGGSGQSGKRFDTSTVQCARYISSQTGQWSCQVCGVCLIIVCGAHMMKGRSHRITARLQRQCLRCHSARRTDGDVVGGGVDHREDVQQRVVACAALSDVQVRPCAAALYMELRAQHFKLTLSTQCLEGRGIIMLKVLTQLEGNMW